MYRRKMRMRDADLRLKYFYDPTPGSHLSFLRKTDFFSDFLVFLTGLMKRVLAQIRSDDHISAILAARRLKLACSSSD